MTSNYMIKYTDHEFEAFDPNIKICKKRRKQREGRGQMMDIKLPTVKTHVSHILTKLGVSRRSEAKTAAKKLRLVLEHL